MILHILLRIWAILEGEGGICDQDRFEWLCKKDEERKIGSRGWLLCVFWVFRFDVRISFCNLSLINPTHSCSSHKYPLAALVVFTSFFLLLCHGSIVTCYCVYSKSFGNYYIWLDCFVSGPLKTWSAVDPGVVKTNIMRDVPTCLRYVSFLVLNLLGLLKSPESGVCSIVDAALAPPVSLLLWSILNCFERMNLLIKIPSM